MIFSDVEFAFSGFILILPIIALIIFAIVKARKAESTKLRKYGAIILIVALIVSISTIIMINIPPSRKVELSITLDFKSNSTSHESLYQYHWVASRIQTNANWTLIDWNNQYGEAHSYDTGALNDLLQDRNVEDFNIQWAELKPYANETWTLQLNFYVGIVFIGQLILQGNSQTIHVHDYGITDTHFSSSLLDGLDSLGIEGLEIYMNISFKISASVLRSCFQEISIKPQITDDIEMVVNDIVFGIIP